LFIVQIQVTQATETQSLQVNVVAGTPKPGGLEQSGDIVTILKALELAREAILSNARFEPERKIAPVSVLPRINGRNVQ
jgi:hypothetical protein